MLTKLVGKREREREGERERERERERVRKKTRTSICFHTYTHANKYSCVLAHENTRTHSYLIILV